MLPTTTDVHVDGQLSNVAESWIVGDDNYIADRVFPTVTVQKLSDLVARYNRKDFFNVHDVRPRAPGVESQGVGYHVGRSRYNCVEYAHHIDIPDELRANADRPFNMDTDATRIIVQRLKLKREYLFGVQAFVAGVWTNAFNVGVPWNVAGSTPINDVDSAKVRMHLSTGFQPNTLVINKQVFYFLRRHAQITALYAGNASPTPTVSQSQVAAALDIERLIVAPAVYDNGPMEGQWDGRWCLGNHALLCHVTSAPSLMQPSAGYTFAYTAANHGGTTVQMERYRIANDAKADRIVGNIHFDEAIVEQDLGIFFPNVIAGAGVLNQMVVDVMVGVP